MTLIDELKENPELRKLFGKQELLIVEKQLLGVVLKPSEKTRLSRDIRKKFQAIASLIPFQKEFALKRASVVKDITNDTVHFLQTTPYAPRIRRIIVFGSTAENSRRLLSDIDIAVEFAAISEKDAVKFRLEMIRKVHKSVDLQIYNVLPEKIKKRIDLHGKTVYQRTN